MEKVFNLKKILLSLLFSTGEPLGIKDIQSVITRFHSEQEKIEKARQASKQPHNIDNEKINETDSEPEQSVIEDIFAQVPTLLTATQIRETMDEIAAEIEEADEVYRLVQSSSGFKLTIAPDYSDWVRLLRNDPRPQKLTRAALETLAIVAYRQPVTRAEIEAIRGVNADGALARLTERDLVRISGRADLPGRPIQYSTTRNFLDFAGINSLDELPASDVLSPNQISDWIRRASGSDLKDGDVGLPNSEEADGTDASQKELENQAREESKDSKEEKLEVGATAFPSNGAESAGSEEEFDDSPDDIDADSIKPNTANSEQNQNL